MAGAKVHPHTHAVKMAATEMNTYISGLADGPKFMETKSSRTQAMHAVIDKAHPDIQRLRGSMPLATVHRLAKLGE